MTRLLILVTLLAIAVAPTLGEAASSKRLHMIATVEQQTFTGNLASPKLGDRLINNVKLFNDRGTQVGTGGAVCTVVSEPPQATVVQCLLTAVFADGQIIFGGAAPFPEVGTVGHFGILGGTDRFSKARGDATLIVLANGDVDSTFDLD
jgi:hypothetical protein